MRKLTWSIVALAFFISSCKKKDHPIPVTPVADWYISTTVSIQVKNGVATKNQDSILYTYNADKTLHTAEEFSIDNGLTYYDLLTFIYENGKLVKLNRQTGRNDAPSTLLEFQYTGNNLTRFYAPGQAAANYDSLVYENSKLASIVKVKSGAIDRILEYTFENNNIAVEKQYGWNAVAGTKELHFTTKYVYNNISNPRKTLGFPYYLLNDQAGSAHLISMQELTNRFNVSDTGTEMAFLSYTRERNDKQQTVADTSWYKPGAADSPKAGYITRYRYTDLSK